MTGSDDFLTPPDVAQAGEIIAARWYKLGR